MLIFWADRWLHYASLPWAALYGIGVSKMHGKQLALFIAISIGYVALYASIYFLTSVSRLWWQPGD
jgi:hypothetical protein